MNRARMMILWVAVSLALAPTLVFAEEDSSDLFTDPGTPTASGDESRTALPATTAAAPFTLTLTGSHEFDYHFPTDGDSWNYEGEMKAPAFRNEVGIEVRDGDVKLVSRWAFDLLLSRSSSGDTELNGYSNGQLGSWDALTRLRPLENYISWSPAGSGAKLAFGCQVFAWGVADKVNPTDNLNPRDYTTGVLDPAKIPVLAADINWYPTDAISVEAVFVPFEQPDRWPRDSAQAVTASTGTSGAVTYDTLDFAPDSLVAGGKINWRGAPGDFSVSYLYDIDPYYSPDISGVLYSLSPSAAISLERARIHRLGGDAKTTWGRFGLWLEGCASITDRSANDDTRRRSRLDYVTGFDFNYGPNDTCYVNVQYIGSYIPGYDDAGFDAAKALDAAYGESFSAQALTNSLGFETEGLLQGLSVDLKWELFDSRLTPQVKAVYTLPFFYDDSEITRCGNLAINPEIDFMPVDSLHLILGADIAYAWYKDRGSSRVQLETTSDRIGIFTPFNNVYLKIRYKWNADLKK